MTISTTTNMVYADKTATPVRHASHTPGVPFAAYAAGTVDPTPSFPANVGEVMASLQRVSAEIDGAGDPTAEALAVIALASTYLAFFDDTAEHARAVYYLEGVAAGLDDSVAAPQIDVSLTHVPIHFNVEVTGTATEAAVEAIIVAYCNALTDGDDVDASVMSDAILALGTVTTVDTFELKISDPPTGSTADIVIAAGSVAGAIAANIDYTAS
jgi:glycine cleavage system pyridoxal-binding protein P